MIKSVLISGGTSGIGRGAVFQLLSEGFRVITFSRSKEQCKLLEKELENDYDVNDFLVLSGDVTDEVQMKDVVEAAIQKFSQIDILINNAGFGYFAEVDDFDMKRFKEMIETNIVGMTLLTKLVVPHMKKRKTGLILNIASISGKRASAGGEFYSATKFGVMGYSEGIRDELRSFGIKVSILAPGMIDTKFFDKETLKSRAEKRGLKSLPEMLQVEDISRVISLVCNQSEVSDIQDVLIMPFKTSK